MSMPANNLAALATEAWSDVLPGVRVGPRTHFLEAGGASLSAVRACARLTASLGVNVPIRLFFEHRDLEDFVQSLRQLV